MLRLKKAHAPRVYGKLRFSDNELSEEAGQAQAGPEWLSKEGVHCFGIYWGRGRGWSLSGLNFLPRERQHRISYWLARTQGKRLLGRGLPESCQQSKSKNGVRLYDNLGLVHKTGLECGEGLILMENGMRWPVSPLRTFTHITTWRCLQ